ncbi:class II aldolase/adducin family protein [Haloarcula nitratireducens]|uniref:Class II aldolase/adducin family protein n=1 Tax=Haloarcula nitratireducens TaxID=2487749 RepID=A0AAW4PHR8_9EURY|nr:class II aldolase/adducin family protein [Halomicroarcula nitratireducens]MBX0297123.1 class II aldolase/adducin family protein [Halomicroarcula nitratireducens]
MTSRDLAHYETRNAICEYGRSLLEDDLTTGTGGNLSARLDDDLVAISPSGIPYDDVTPADVPVVKTDGTVVEGEVEPSTELPMHLAVYESRPDVGGVVHTHSPYATTFASLGESIPASHYLISFTGTEVPVAEYETHATTELGEAAVESLGEEFNATLLRNHGVLTADESLDDAYTVALMVEYCARIHHQAKAIGDPEILPDDEIDRLSDKLDAYGQ